MQLYPLAGITRWSRGELVEHFQQFCWECVAAGYTSDDQLDDREREWYDRVRVEFAIRGEQLTLL